VAVTFVCDNDNPLSGNIAIVGDFAFVGNVDSLAMRAAGVGQLVTASLQLAADDGQPLFVTIMLGLEPAFRSLNITSPPVAAICVVPREYVAFKIGLHILILPLSTQSDGWVISKTGAPGVVLGAEVPEPLALVQPLTVCVTV
jgi:hypothetical protein